MPSHFEIAVERDHPAFAGHFPGEPIVPGVLLLDWVLCEIETREHCVLLPGELSVIKFLKPVRPGDVLAVSYERDIKKITCRIECQQQLVATAALEVRADASGSA